MKLFASYTSPYARHCRLALNQFGINYEMIDTDYAASAAGSPTLRVPFLQDGDLKFTDSSSILMHLHGLAGMPFIASATDMERYALINTTMDATINLFLLERDGLTPDQGGYLARQQARVEAGLAALEAHPWNTQAPLGVCETRLACFLDWGLFRQRIRLDECPNLIRFLEQAREWPTFSETAPPR